MTCETPMKTVAVGEHRACQAFRSAPGRAGVARLARLVRYFTGQEAAEQLEVLYVGSEADGQAGRSSYKSASLYNSGRSGVRSRAWSHSSSSSEYLSIQARQAARWPRIAALSGRTAKQRSRCRAGFRKRAEYIANTCRAIVCPV